MRAFLTILLDALRLLRARALFWITLAISALAALLYLSIGFDEEGITFFFGLQAYENDYIRAGSPLAEMFYLAIFSMVVVSIWLSWIAVILALITCAPIFPDFMKEGHAGWVLSQPISRLRLFIYKTVCGLLFAFLQTLIFAAIVFLAIRWRVGSWNPTVFWAVPLVVLMFSYLWSVMVAAGVWTRSTMVGLMAALLVWAGAWLAKMVEEVAWSAAELGQLPGGGRVMALDEAEQARWQGRLAGLSLPYVVLPKTSDTVQLLSRLVVVEGRGDFAASELLNLMALGEPVRDPEIEEAMQRHSIAFIIGSSLAFEGLVLALGAWGFCRRDY